MLGDQHVGVAPRDEIERFRQEFGAIVLAADELAYREQGYRLVLGGVSGMRPAPLASWTEVSAAIESLARSTPPLNEHTRCYLQGILHALHTFAGVRDGATITYLDQVGAYLELSDVWVQDDELTSLREQLLDLLGQLGFPAELERGLRMWESRHHVPTDDVRAVAEPLVARSHAAAIARGVPIPNSVAVSVVVRSTPYYAYATYHGDYHGAVELASNIEWTFESIKHSMCHEAFPGHQASASAREAAIADGDWGLLVLPGLANSPTSPISEGLAENGTRILDWITTKDDELFSISNALKFGVLTNAAILRHEHGEPRETVIDFMVAEAGVRRDWATYQYGFLTDPLWHTSFPHYWHGRKLIQETLRQFRGREAALFEALYRRPQTVTTLRRFLASDSGGQAGSDIDCPRRYC